jgi:hypothetical protein
VDVAVLKAAPPPPHPLPAALSPFHYTLPMPWLANLQSWRQAASRFTEVHYDIGPPASERDIRALEAERGRPCPRPLRTFLSRQSGHVNFWWQMDSERAAGILGTRNEPYCGYMEFNPPTMANIVTAGTYATGTRFAAEVVDRWSAAWGFLPVSNGDALALDTLADPDNPPVVYLNHEEPDEIWTLSPSFDAFLEAFTFVGCVGPEWWLIRHFATVDGRPFIPAPPPRDYLPGGRLDPMCPNSRKLRAFFGLSVPW